MTANQVSALRAQEERRANLAQESLKGEELARKREELAESKRANLANEAIKSRANELEEGRDWWQQKIATQNYLLDLNRNQWEKGQGLAKTIISGIGTAGQVVKNIGSTVEPFLFG